jgi:hypothetical protein
MNFEQLKIQEHVDSLILLPVRTFNNCLKLHYVVYLYSW